MFYAWLASLLTTWVGWAPVAQSIYNGAHQARRPWLRLLPSAPALAILLPAGLGMSGLTGTW
ncbi:MAG: hypothetical protein ACRDY2_00140, partial [Acidimicrobiales bacterium]